MIVGTPAATPVTTPVPLLTVANDVLLLLQVPSGVASLSAVVKPAHTLVVPVIAAGSGFTVTTLVMIQPVGKVYVTVAVPAVIPVITLPAAVATAVLLLLHVPEGVASLSVVVKPAQTAIVPVIDAGNGLTVTGVVMIQPVVLSVYVIVGVPAATPVTTPVALLTVASNVLLLLQLPSGVASLKLVVKPAHTLVVPVIAAGSGLTVAVLVMIQLVGNV